MSYRFDEISVKVSDDEEGFEKINEIYGDIFAGKIPLMHDNKRKLDEDLFPLGQYEKYKENEYVFKVFADALDCLFQIHKWINYGDIELFEGEGSTIDKARRDAREKLNKDTTIKRVFRNDFECIIPKKDSKDGKVHCELYVGIENKYRH